MLLRNKICCINMALLLLVTGGFAYFTDTWPGNGFFYMFGFIGICGGVGSLLLGLLLLLRKDKGAAHGYLLSSLLMLALGGAGFLLLNQY